MSSTIGQILKNAREEQDISLEELSLKTHIKVRYLRAMEDDEFEVLPSFVQQKGFLRSYAQQLGLEPDPLLNQLSGVSETGDVKEQPGEQSRAPGEKEGEEAVRTDQPGEAKFKQIGEELGEQRDRLGLSLEEVERQIHIPKRYLKSIEKGHLEELPSTVQGRGMLKNYAEFIGLAPDALLLRYADVLQSRLRAKHPESGKKRQQQWFPLWMRRIFTGPSLSSLLILAVVAAALIWSGFQVFGGNSGEGDAAPTIPGVAEVLIPSATLPPTVSSTPTPDSDQENGQDPAVTLSQQDDEAVQTQPAPVSSEVQIQLIISERTFVQVAVDGQEEFSGRMLPGSVHVFGGEERIELITGNAAGVTVIFNQQDLGVLGFYGEVVSRIFTAEGIATATPTVTPTLTITPTPSPTLTATPTPFGLEP